MHWILVPTDPSIDCATARARIVFAVPGTSSKRTCPPHASAVRTRRISSRLPCTTVSMFASSRSATAMASRSSSLRTGSADTPTSVVGESRPIVPLVGPALPVDDRARRLHSGRRTGPGRIGSSPARSASTRSARRGSPTADSAPAPDVIPSSLGCSTEASVPTTKPPTTTTSSAAAEATFPNVRLERRRARAGDTTTGRGSASSGAARSSSDSQRVCSSNARHAGQLRRVPADAAPLDFGHRDVEPLGEQRTRAVADATETYPSC